MDNTTLRTGFVGVLATTGGSVMSLLPHLEAWLRVASLLVGLLIGLVTLTRLLHKELHRKHKHEDK